MEKSVWELAHHLKQEKLFIESERQHLESLNKQLMKTIENVYQASFIRGEQKRNYNDLVLQPRSSPPACCQQANSLSQLQFIEGYQVLGYLETCFGDFLTGLRENPRLCGHALVVGESFNQEWMQFAASCLFSSVYGNCILPEDELYLLYLLNNLIQLQLGSSENPRRLLHHGSCAFSRVFRAYIDTLPQAKVFLTAALREPLMQLLMEDELFLDIDPANAAGRFPQEERLRRFGREGTKDYEEALANYQLWTIGKLVKITNRFMTSIEQAMHCFPSTLAWLVRAVYEALINSKGLGGASIRPLCVDLVFTFFVCDAIVSPEPHGIIDAPVSHIARFNLIQVAQILQGLAMNNCEERDPRMADIYFHFDNKVLTGLFDRIIGPGIPEQPPVATVGNCPLMGLKRSSFMIPKSHLISLISFLLQVQEHLPEASPSSKELAVILNPIKPHFDQFLVERESQSNSSVVASSPSQSKKSPNMNHHDGSSHKSTANGHHHHASSPPTHHKKNLLNRVRSSRKSKSHSMPDGPQDNHDNSLISHSHSNASLHSQLSSSVEEKDDTTVNGHGSSSDQLFSNSLRYDTVLVVPLPGNMGTRECPGMMSEEKVLTSLQNTKSVPQRSKTPGDGEREGVTPGAPSGEGTIEKRTRFSLSHDEGSIGNTSDNLEAISEAASNHSVASSMDDVEQVDQPDNLSDMVSANVSGRGTPNVSGRDTPSSQITEGEEGLRGGGSGGDGGPPNPLLPHPHRGGGGGCAPGMPVMTVVKPASDDIEERFGRFEIRPIQGGDETVSLVSDTWSTDVLASDSETVESVDPLREGGVVGGGVPGVGGGRGISGWGTSGLSGCRGSSGGEELLNQHLVELDRVHRQLSGVSLGRGGSGVGGSEYLRGETFETASEAWSTDVLASDSERLTEFDTDDAQSVTRSDDTGRSEVEVELLGASGEAGNKALENPLINPEDCLLTSSPPRVSSSKSLESEGVDDCEESEGNMEASEESSMGTLKAASGSHEHRGKGRKYAPVTRVDEGNDLRTAGKAFSFKPIHTPDLTQEVPTDVPGGDDVVTRNHTSDALGIQSLGRLSLNLSDLPSNGGIVSNGQLLSFNSVPAKDLDAFPQKDEGRETVNGVSGSSLCKELDDATPMMTVKGENGDRRPPLTEDGSIHLSTTSLVSSGSSESDGLLSQSTKDPQSLTTEVSPTTGHEGNDSILATQSSPSPSPGLASTGAIPKSISFDKTAERGDREVAEGDPKRGKKGIFKALKLPTFKGRRKVSGSLSSRADDTSVSRTSSLTAADLGIRRSFSEDSRRTILEESTDEILAKYRKKPEATVPDSETKQPAMVEFSRQVSDAHSSEEDRIFLGICESSYAFKDAKRKLRMALSATDFFMPFHPVYFTSHEGLLEEDVLSWLRTQLAQAQNMQDRSSVAQLNETLRCLQLFDPQGREALIQSLKEDYQNRSPYIGYLIRCRQGLLSSIAHLKKFLLRLDADTNIIMTSMVEVCVRMFLEKRDEVLNRFTKNFMLLTVPDEKVELVETFLTELHLEVERDPMWISSTPEQLNLAKLSLERSVMSHIYIHALYPNGDGDVSRDQVLFEHMKKLSAIITPSHKDLKIPKHYQYECPWPSAQEELMYLGAYKTSEDKVRCVVRASKIIMNLLSMGHDTSVPAADDFIPVLVYVLIKLGWHVVEILSISCDELELGATSEFPLPDDTWQANPPCLLSTVQYVDLFYEQRLLGEDRYWWTQFCSSIEFIKTMEYTP